MLYYNKGYIIANLNAYLYYNIYYKLYIILIINKIVIIIF